MATARGARTILLAKQEVSYGVNPAGSDWRQYPFVPPLDLGGAQALLDSPVIGLSTGRDPADPFYDAVTVDGSFGIPIDLNDIGFWLKMLMGAPVTSGGGADKTHTYKSGSATALPSFSAEVGYPDVPTYLLMTGCKAGGLTVNAGPTGRPTATVNILAQDVTRAGTSVDAAPTLATGYEQFNNFQGTISRNGTALAYITAASMTFSNGLEAIRDIGSGNNIKEALEQDTAVSGQLTARLSETTLLTDSEGTTPIEIDLLLQISATKSIEFTLPRAFLPRRKATVQGRAGVDVTFDLRGSFDATAVCAMQVVLKNQTAAY
jgi:hypothetical protein